MTGHVVWILVVIVGGIVVFGVLTQLVQGAGRAWRELAERYPAQGVGPEAVRGEARIGMGEGASAALPARGCLWILMPWTWFRSVSQVRYAADDEYLHLETEGGRLVGRSAMSIPWGEIEISGVVPTHLGEYALMRVSGVEVAFPAAAVERELEVRAGLNEGAEAGDGMWEEGV